MKTLAIRSGFDFEFSGFTVLAFRVLGFASLVRRIRMVPYAYIYIYTYLYTYHLVMTNIAMENHHFY